MGGQPFEKMKDRAVSFIRTLRASADPSTQITVSVFPFGDTVRFPDAYSDWLDPDFNENDPTKPNPFIALQSERDDICVNGWATRKSNKRVQCIPLTEWNGCFADLPDNRITSRAMDHVPNLEPEINLTQNAHLPDAYKHIGYCPGEGATSIILETDAARVVRMIEGMSQNWETAPPPERKGIGYGTGTDTAVSWAWRVLHPSNRGEFKETNTLPEAFSDLVSKHLVLLTDGQPTGIARANDPSRTNTAKANLEQICQIIRSENEDEAEINVWPIAYRNRGGQGTVMPEVKGCVGGQGAYYDAGTSNVEEVFEKVGKAIAKIRARITG